MIVSELSVTVGRLCRLVEVEYLGFVLGLASEAMETGLPMILTDDQTEMALSNLRAIFMGYVAYPVLTRDIRWLEYASGSVSASDSTWWSVTGRWRNVAVPDYHSHLYPIAIV